jgi:hypothetical protein
VPGDGIIGIVPNTAEEDAPSPAGDWLPPH